MINRDALIVIGTVDFVRDGTDERRFAKIDPTHLCEDGQFVVIDRKTIRTQFPAEGHIVWWASPSNVVKGTTWKARVVPIPSDDSNAKRYDLYKVDHQSTPVQLCEVIEPRTSSVLDLRRLLSGGVLKQPRVPAGPLYMRHPNLDGWIGPVHYTVSKEASNEVELTFGGAASGFLPVAALDEGNLLRSRIEGIERVLLVPGTPGMPIAYFNVQSDGDLFESMLKRLRKLKPDAKEAHEISAAIFHRYREVLIAADLTPQSRLQEQARSEALGPLLNDLGTGLAMNEELVQALLGQEEIAKKLDTAIAGRIEQFRVEAQERIEAEVRRDSQAADHARRSIEQAKAEQRALEGAIAHLKQVLAGEASAVTERMVAAVAESLAVRQLIDKCQVPGTTTTPLVCAVPDNPAVAELADAPSLRSALSAESRIREVDPIVGYSTVGCLAACGCALIIGADAERLAASVALAMAGPSAVRVSLAVDAFGWEDVLRSPAACIATTGREAESLGDFLAARTGGDSLTVVVLSGVNRMPPEAILGEILARNPEGGPAVEIAWRDERGQRRKVALSSRLLFIGTVVDGQGAFRISRTILPRVPVVDADRKIVPVVATTEPLPEASPSRVSSSLWGEMVRRAASAEIGDLLFLDLLGGCLSARTTAGISAVCSMIAGGGSLALAEVRRIGLWGAVVRDASDDLGAKPSKEVSKELDELRCAGSVQPWRRLFS